MMNAMVGTPSASRTPSATRASAAAPASWADQRLVGRLREDLLGSGFTVDGVEQLLGPVAHRALAREQPLAAVLATERGLARGWADPAAPGRPVADQVAPAVGFPAEPVAALLAAFVLGRAVPRSALQRALPRTGVDGLLALGLVQSAGAADDDSVRSLVDLRPYACRDRAGAADWWIASDLGELATGRPLDAEHVLGVGGASVMLARTAVRTPAARALDLGTGCGIQALHASRHARAVLATDVSARALAFAGLNLALNDVRTVTTRRGSLLEPVAGERFDLVVSNPPFVITPRRPGAERFTYRDGGLAGDEIVADLVAGLPGVLADGGVAQLLGNWEQRSGEPWQDRVSAWLDRAAATVAADDADGDGGGRHGAVLDAWVVQRELQDPAEYAETWVRDAGQRGPEADAVYRAYLEDFAARQVEAIGFGLVVLRRRDAGGPAFRRVEEQRGGGDAPLGDHLAGCLAAVRLLAGLDDDGLAGLRLRVAADVTEERHGLPGAADPAVILLRQGGGFGRVLPATTALAGLVGACDGELPVGVLVGALAGLLERPADELAAELLSAVRTLVADGLLLPA
jgi:hypothetical protein